jgi:hypothetical protein
VIKETISSTPMLVLLGILVFVYHFDTGFCFARGLESVPGFEFLYDAAFLCGVVWWLKAEARKDAIKLVYCPGLLVGVGWIIIIPYYLIKTRGVRGLIPLFALIGSFLSAHLLAEFVYLILST